MKARIDITDIKDNKEEIWKRIHKQYPENPYMPIIQSTETDPKDNKTYVVVSVIID